MSNENGSNGNGNGRSGAQSFEIKVGLAEMLKGGVIMDVTNPEQAKIAEDSGAAAVMALERVPADIRKEGGVARMAAVEVIEGIQRTVSIPVMAKCRIGHFAEAQVLQALDIDFIDESEVLTPADEHNHVWKWDFAVPFVCGCRNLGEALRRIGEGAAMIRTKGEPGTGNVVEAVRHMRLMNTQIRWLTTLDANEVMNAAKELRAPYDLVEAVAASGELPVVNFAAGGIATPSDAALMMQLGCDGVFVGSGIFKSGDPSVRARAIVEATTFYKDPEKIAKVAKINQFHVSLFAEFLEKLEATPEGDGSLLDHVLYLYGSGMGNPNVHDHTNLPILVAGGAAGNMKGGRHIKYEKATPLANLHLTLLDKVGVRLDSFADSQGQVEELFAPV